jgi:hypothetical protein
VDIPSYVNHTNMKIYSRYKYITYLFLIMKFPTTSANNYMYQKKFGLVSYSNLTDNSGILFSAEGSSFARTLNKCSKFCSEDRRCIGIELCTFSDTQHRCRVCCQWKRIGWTPNLMVDSQHCKYMEAVCH